MKNVMTLMIFLCLGPLLSAQCDEGIDSPGQLLSGTAPVAWPKDQLVAWFVTDGTVCGSTCYEENVPDHTRGAWAAAVDIWRQNNRTLQKNNSNVGFYEWSSWPPDYPDTSGPWTYDAYFTVEPIHRADIGGNNGLTASSWGCWADQVGQAPTTCTWKEVDAQISIADDIADDLVNQKVLVHEIGHTFALDDCDSCGTNTTIMQRYNVQADQPSNCDNETVNRVTWYQ